MNCQESLYHSGAITRGRRKQIIDEYPSSTLKTDTVCQFPYLYSLWYYFLFCYFTRLHVPVLENLLFLIKFSLVFFLKLLMQFPCYTGELLVKLFVLSYLNSFFDLRFKTCTPFYLYDQTLQEEPWFIMKLALHM